MPSTKIIGVLFLPFEYVNEEHKLNTCPKSIKTSFTNNVKVFSCLKVYDKLSNI